MCCPTSLPNPFQGGLSWWSVHKVKESGCACQPPSSCLRCAAVVPIFFCKSGCLGQEQSGEKLTVKLSVNEDWGRRAMSALDLGMRSGGLGAIQQPHFSGLSCISVRSALLSSGPSQKDPYQQSHVGYFWCERE